MELNLFFRIVFLCLWLLYLSSRLVPSRNLPSLDRSRKERRSALREEGLYIIFTFLIAWYGNLIVAGLYLLNFSWFYWSYFNLLLEIRFIGLFIAIILIPYTYWIGKTIADNFSFTIEVQNGQQLITSGPYARVRHPIYASAILFLAAMVLVSDNWLFLVMLILIIPGLYIRMKKEEQMMIEQFGEEYRGYIRQTGRIFPKLFR